jgi:hypothetical protein
VRTTLDVFALVEPEARDCGMTTILRGAVARLVTLEPELARVLVRHSAYVAALEPIVDVLAVELPAEAIDDAPDRSAPRAADPPGRMLLTGPLPKRAVTHRCREASHRCREASRRAPRSQKSWRASSA